MDLNNLPIKSFRGGISPEGDKGPRGSFKYGYGMDIHGTRDSLKCNQKLKKDSGTVVTDLVLAMVYASNGNVYAFGDTGKVYRKKSGTWTLVYTEPGGKITGAVEFKTSTNTYILFATQTKLRKITTTNADGTWTSNVSDAGTFSHANASTFRTMRVALGVVLISDGPYLAMFDFEEAFNPISLELPPRIWSKTLLDRSNEASDRVIMGTVGDGIPEAWFITWDGQADSWLAKKSAQGKSVNQMAFLEGGIIGQIGNDGSFKFWNFAETYPMTQVPNVTSGYPNAVVEYKTIPHFGLQGEKGGVYSIGRVNKNNPLAVNLEYIPSHGLQNGEIGALVSDGTNLYVSWKATISDVVTYGIDVVDQDNKAVALYQSLEMDMGQPQSEKIFRHVKVVTRPLPESTSVRIRVKATRDSDWVLASTQEDDDAFNDAGESKCIFNIENQGEIYEVEALLTPSGNNSPEVLSINTYFDFDNDI